MQITIIYDNNAWDKNLIPDWGFSCLIRFRDKHILFDTGAKGEILLGNMRKLHIDPMIAQEVFISHDHWDHTGGLSHFLKINPSVKVYIPYSCSDMGNAGQIIRIKDGVRLHENIYSTGELANVEQSLILETDKGVVLVAGCSHPGVEKIIRAGSKIGKVTALIGGLHGFNDYNLLKNMEIVCPTHCTEHIPEIKSMYPDKYIEGGAGRVIDI